MEPMEQEYDPREFAGESTPVDDRFFFGLDLNEDEDDQDKHLRSLKPRFPSDVIAESGHTVTREQYYQMGLGEES